MSNRAIVHYIGNDGQPATIAFDHKSTAERYALTVKKGIVEHNGVYYVPKIPVHHFPNK